MTTPSPCASFAYAFRAFAIAYRSLDANDLTFVKIRNLLRFLFQNYQDVPNPTQKFDDDAQAKMLREFMRAWPNVLTSLSTEDIVEDFYFEAGDILSDLSFENGLEIMRKLCQAWCEKSLNLLRNPWLFPIIVEGCSGKILSALNE